MSNKINKEDLQTVEFSIDQVCTLYFYGDRVIRGVHDQYVEQVKEMMSNGMIDELVEKGLFVQTWISELEIEGHDLVIEHKKIPYWNYPYEWSFSMLHAAANIVLDCNEVANKYGFELFDVHAFNVVFDMSKPVYVDFGSFIKTDERDGSSWSGYNNFYNSFYMPLYLYNRGYSDLPNSIHLYNGLFSDKDLFLLRHKYSTILGSYLSNQLFKAHTAMRRLSAARYTRVIEKYGKHQRINQVLQLKKNLQGFYSASKARKLIGSVSKSKADSYWKDYHNDKNPGQDPRFIRINEIINTELKDASSLIELASNQGKFANFILENSQIDEIIATDYDRNALDHIYLRNQGRSDILPLVFDFVRPNNRSNTTNVLDRLNADVVMALAVTHHLILTQDVGLQHIFNVLSSLTKKYVVVEFMPLGLYSGDLNTIPEIPDFYNLEWFTKNFKNNFDLILDEQLEVNRHVFVGQVRTSNRVE
ncbi:hypothetical protein [Nonlabens xiamenensis]|uniref:hypothetical protein n=1 Tax=Nonlabens xiamenensis TaxID=2341043 RepID=UPI000F60732E|nr:hypothetical protein [Nonlabens xiamenensis]